MSNVCCARAAEMDEEYSPTAEAHMNDAWDPEEPSTSAAGAPLNLH